MTCNCTGRCRKPPYTCSGLEEPDFLTAKQRREHERRFLAGETNWSAPFEPWVVRTWVQHLDEGGWYEHIDQIKANIMAVSKICNDPNLTHEEKLQLIEQVHNPNKHPDK